MAAERRNKPENVPSRRLSKAENDELFDLIGTRCSALATAVVQVFLADNTSGNNYGWNKRCTGLLTFIKDYNERSFYFRVYSLKTRALKWEQVLDGFVKYNELREQFHTFEADGCFAGLSFDDKDEAREFFEAVDKKLKERIEKRRTKRRQMQVAGGGKSQRPMLTSEPQSSLPVTPAPAPAVISPAKAGKGKGKAKKLTKENISQASDLHCLNHVGWNPDSGFDITQLDADMKSLFDKAGISKEVLEDEVIRKKISDVIGRQRGFDVVKKKVGNRAPPPAPSLAAPSSAATRNLPPPPPWHGSSLAPNDSQYLKPVPTTAPSGSPLPRSRNRSGSALDVAPPPPYSTRPQRPTATPPPPPPPPPSSGVPGPPPPSSARARPLPPPPLNAIEKARELKHLDADMKSPFDMAGILKAALEDEDIRKKIYEIIEKQVSKDAVKNKNDNHGLPPAPRPAAPKSAAPSSAAARNIPPPPPPPKHGSFFAPQASRDLQPLPTTAFSGAQPPRRIRGFPALGGAPLPFPSTRRQGFTAATPPPPHQSGVSVPPRTPSAGARPPAPPLNAIEKARQPKHIDHSPLPVKVTEERGGNLLNAPKNMVQRNQAVNPSGDSDEEDDDDEWDED